MPTTAQWSGTPSIKGSTETMRMILLTFSLIGISFTWGIEMTYCTPYLLQLGLTKSKTSLVWIAGPLSGLIMQPIVGAIADRSTSKYGRRRPFMVIGSVIVGFCMVVLGWTKEIVGIFVQEGDTQKTVSIVLAVLAIYALDFAINAVQACCRSLIVDTLPISQQQQGSAWASRLGATGNVVGYFVGTLDLVSMLPTWLGGDTQFKKMTLVSASGLWIAVGLTSWAVTERRLLASGDATQTASISLILKDLWVRTFNLPPRIQAICWCQFWGWIGWFPFLFYSSTWVGETYYRYEHPEPEPGSPDSHDALGNIGRLGSIALVIFSLITFTASVLLPYLVKNSESSSNTNSNSSDKYTPRPPSNLPIILQTTILKLSAFKPDLITAWTLSNLAFAFIMFFAPVARSVRFATTLVALCGVPWAVTGWAPFSELGIEINKLALNPSNASYVPVSHTGDEDSDSDNDEPSRRPGPLLNRPHRTSSSASSTHVLRLHHHTLDIESTTSSTGELAGIYLGVLNVYTTLPQLVGTFIAWIVFSILEPSKNNPNTTPEPNSKHHTSGKHSSHEKGNGTSVVENPDHHRWLDVQKNAPNAIAVCLFIGALCALVAARQTRKLKKMS